MGLREQAALDARTFLEDSISGFGQALTLTSPAGVVTALTGFGQNVSVTIDPETGQAVSGRRASVALSLAALPAMPVAVADGAQKPWLVTFESIQGVSGTWKVVEVLPDRAMGVVVLLLEGYATAA